MDKVSKDSVNYRKGDKEKRCGNCAMFNIPRGTWRNGWGSCDLVLGRISFHAVCDKWVAK